MKINLLRQYFQDGTNGELIYDNWVLSKTIELPWLNNEPNISCIPEGTYPLEIYPSSKFGMTVRVCDVPNRSGILFHPANYALKELRGCIAPCTTVTHPGLGHHSKAATDKFYNMVARAIKVGAKPLLIISSEGFPYEAQK